MTAHVRTSPACSEPTARELEVFAAFCRHRSRKIAAAELGISDQTAAVHLKHLYSKRPELRHTTRLSADIPQDRAVSG